MDSTELLVRQALEQLTLTAGPGRLQQLQILQGVADSETLPSNQLQGVTDCLAYLLLDSNNKVRLGAVQVLQNLLNHQGQDLASYSNTYLLALVDCLGDANGQVKAAAATALTAALQQWDLAATLQKFAPAWEHRNYHVKQGVMAAVTAILASKPVALSLPDQWDSLVLQPAAHLLDDPHRTVREAALQCIEELHEQLGQPVMEAIGALPVKAAQLKELYVRLGQLQASAEAVQHYPLFQPATALLTRQCSGSNSSRSDCSNQSTETDSLSIANTSPIKAGPRRQPSSSSGMEHSNSSTAAKKASTAAVPKITVRRGGFKDSGGLTAAGELPEAIAIWVDSERDLRGEVDKLVPGLDEKQEWTKRIEALLRLEGLVKGGAAAFDCFLDMLKTLQQSLTVQLNDRRSAVSRQACRSLSVLAAALGSRFDLHALYFLPIIFKITVITVQVMADAADLCVHSLLHHCHSPKLLKPLADVICTDKNAKLRQHCAKYMLQALEDWDLETCSRSLDLVEAAIRSAAQDSSSATRSYGRNMFGAYMQALPQRAQAFLKRMDTSLQEKLSQALLTYAPGQYHPALAESQAQLSKTGSAGSLPILPSTPPSRPPTGRSSTQPGATSAAMLSSALQDSSHQLMAAKRGSRKSAGGNALRILASATQLQTSDEPADFQRPASTVRRVSSIPPQQLSSNTSTQQPPPTVLQSKAQRQLAPNPLPLSTPRRDPSSHRPQRVAQTEVLVPDSGHAQQGLGSADVYYDSSMHGSTAGARDVGHECSTSGRQDWQHADEAASVPQLLAMAASAGADWKVRVGVFEAIQQLLGHQHSVELTMHMDRVVQLILEHISDAHFKVAHAALLAVQAALQHQTGCLEGFLDRLLPALSHRLTDAKEVLRSAATGCLEMALRLYPLEVCLPQLARSLDSVKAAKARIALLQVFSTSCVAAVTTAAALPGLRVWVGKAAGLVGDRNAELRRAACQALQLVYTCMDGPTLLAHIAQARAPDQMTLRRALAPMLPNLDAQLVPYSRTRAVQPSAQRPSSEPPASMLPPSLPDQALDTAVSQQQPQIHSPSQKGVDKDSQAGAAGIPTAFGGLLGDVTNTAKGQSAVSPRDQPIPLSTDASFDSIASSPTSKRHSLASINSQQQPQQQQQQHLEMTRQDPEVLSRQKRISVDTRGSFKQSVFRVSDLDPAQHSLQAAQGFDRLSQGAASQLTAANPWDALTPLPLQPARLPLTEQSDPGQNRAHEQGQGHASSLAQHSSLAPHTLHGARAGIGHSPRALPQAQTAPGLMPASLGPDPEAVQAANKAALLQTAQRAQQADAGHLANAVAALQPLVALAGPHQLQQCLPQVVPALAPALQADTWQAQEAAVAVVKGLIRQAGSALQPWLPALLPGLLQAACSNRPQVCMAADEGFSLLIPQTDPAACLALLTPNLPAASTVNTPACQPTPLIQASVKNIGRAVQRMASADLLRELQSPDLLPGLFEAFDHHSADVRKAVTMCLMYMWQVMGDDLKPFLAPLRVSKIKLVTAYVEQAQAQQQLILQRSVQSQ